MRRVLQATILATGVAVLLGVLLQAGPLEGSPPQGGATAPAAKPAAQPAALAQAPAAAGGEVDLASVEMGGKIESATTEASEPDWVALNLIARTPFRGWSAQNPGVPQEMVFSFLARQAALVAGVQINPTARPTEGGMKDVEIWTSTQSPTEGFTRVAVAALKNEDALQPVTFAPVEARFVKLRIVSAYTRTLNGSPAVTPAVASRVKILEGQRPGYVSILDRNPDLAAIVKGRIPMAPASAAGTPIPPGGLTSCAVPADAPKKSAFPESRRVLVLSSASTDYPPRSWKPNRAIARNDYSLYGRLDFTWFTPHAASPALLLPLLKFDTVALSQICEIDQIVSKEFKQALMAWVAAGHKLIIHDSDWCAAATGPHRAPDYGFLPYRFATMNPGAVGLRGQAQLVESSSLASSQRQHPSFLDIEAWVKETGGNGNELGDSNVIVRYDPHWCGVLLGKNALKKSGFIEAYARYGRGLIIYDGVDFEHVGSPAYEQLVTRELAQPFDPDYLPCSQPLADFVITADTSLTTQFMAAGKTYAYPLSVEANFGYSGKVMLDAAVVPVAPLNPAGLLAAAGRLAPRGETPLVYPILQTPGDLKQLGGGTVILITDGEESCKGDFAAAAKTLKDSGLNLTLNIVGFTLKAPQAQVQLGGLAESTGGHYYGASSGEALARAVLLAAVDKLPYRILDAAGKEVARGEAGAGKAHELPAGDYRVVVTAADQELATPVTLGVARDIMLNVIRGDKLVVEK